MVEFAPGPVNFETSSRSTMMGWLRARSSLRPARRSWSTWLIAPCCLFCNQAADLGDLDLCSDCLISLPWAESFNRESIYGFRANIESPNVQVPLWYAPPIDAALRDLKFHGDLAPARVFGALLAARAAIAGDLPDLIVPVPLHRDRLHERGYNQAAQLARSAADWLGRPCAPRLLERRRATVPQTSLHAPARRRNLMGAFVLGAEAGRWLRNRPAPASRRLALVDDVLTTGATLAAAAEALGSLGSLSIWAVARPMSSSFTSPVTPG